MRLLRHALHVPCVAARGLGVWAAPAMMVVPALIPFAGFKRKGWL